MADQTNKQQAQGSYFTVVYRNVQPGDDALSFMEHSRACAFGWCHAIADRMDAIDERNAAGVSGTGHQTFSHHTPMPDKEPKP